MFMQRSVSQLIWIYVQVPSLSPVSSYSTVPPYNICTRKGLAGNLARGSRWNVRALGARLASGDRYASPSPVRARSRTAKDVDVGSARVYRACDAIEGQARDRYAGRRRPGGRAVLVVLLDDNTVVADRREGDVLVCYSLDAAGGVIDGYYKRSVVAVPV